MPAATLLPSSAASDCAAAGVGDVVDLLGVDAAGCGEQPGQDLVGAARGPAGDGQAPRVVLPALDEVGEARVRGALGATMISGSPSSRATASRRVSSDLGLVGLDGPDHDQAHHHQQRVVGLAG